MAVSTTIQHKSFSFQVKAVDDEQGLIEAYGSVFDVIDLGDDVVKPGAFKRTIQNAKSRVAAGKANYLAVMLWNHDTEHFLPVGGWYDLKEDSQGLIGKGRIAIDTTLGQDVYKLIKGGFVNEFSIGYEVMSGGAHYDKNTGNRNLTELRLWELSPVVFAMNQEALLVGVKSASGSTSWPLGSRDTAWSGSKAHNQIVEWASKDDGSIDSSKMKSVHFWYDGENTDKVTSYKLPFCFIEDGKPTAIPKAIFACAAALSGARGGADLGGDDEAVKAKIARYYSRMAKEFDDDSIKVPWSDDSKATRRTMEKKTLLEHFNEEMAEDLLEDWQDVYLCSLSCAILDALKIGDQPQADISQALDEFKTLVLEKFVAQAVECGLSQYLQDSSYSYSPADYTMQYGSESSPSYRGLMSLSRAFARKAGRSISGANADKIQAHADSVHDMATKAMNMMKEHTKALHAAADDIASMAKKPEDETPPSKEDEQDSTKKPQPPEEKPPKKAASLSQARGATPPSEASTVDEQELEAMLRRLRAMREPAANTTIVA